MLEMEKQGNYFWILNSEKAWSISAFAILIIDFHSNLFIKVNSTLSKKNPVKVTKQVKNTVVFSVIRMKFQWQI
jgi:hypothetical protein